MSDILGIHYEPNVITTIGLIIAVVFLGSKLFQRVGIPQVVGFIVIGVLLGSSGFNLVPQELAEELTFISEIALGLIGFDMGSHLLMGELRQLGHSIIFILLFEALGTFLLVTAGIYLITHDWITALIFGALSSATAPAATIDVLAEYDAKGPLTTSMIAVVGLDDALALLLFSIVACSAETMFSHSATPSFVQIIGLPLVEIGGSVALGIILGLALNSILHRMKKYHDAMAISIGFVLLCVGLAQALGSSLILATMVMGSVVVNRHSEHSKHIRYTIEQAGPVIYVLFFALVGARFRIDLLPTMGLLGIAYVLLRSIGKFTGAWTGAIVGSAVPAVRNNLGLGLLSQAGVAVGLAISASCRFAEHGEVGERLGQTIINVITATTFIVQIIGPIGVKYAIGRAGEIGKARLTEEAWASEGAPQ
ncbi:MAG: cation:proton antiporter [Ardenticatenaceae bacterium]|nr:cation:proton antiporter [Ardenticatenaceae bacterium]MCB9444456.1 cation:proton antiporter [Ardenticatenaceae bacterium]